MNFRNGNGDRAVMEPPSHPNKARTSGTDLPKQRQVPHRRRWLRIFARSNSHRRCDYALCALEAGKRQRRPPHGSSGNDQHRDREQW